MRRRTCYALRQQRKPLWTLFRGSPPPPRPFPGLNKAAALSLLPPRNIHHDSRKRRACVRARVLSTSPPPPPPPRTCRVYNVTGDTVPYDRAWLWQQRLLHERMAWQREGDSSTANAADRHDVLLLLEHPSIYTLGRGSSLDHLRFDPASPSSSCGREVRRTERGGEVTWHGPGQIVGYPVLDLNFHKKDLHWYLRQLEEVVIRVLETYGLEGERETEHTGVWVDGAKVAAIGLNASRWITSHGFALNVNPDLRAFEAIVPCGIQGRPVTRLYDLVDMVGSPPSVDDVETAAVAEGKGSATGAAASAAAATAALDAGSVRSTVMKEFEGVFGVRLEVVEVDAAAVGGGDELERKIFSTECDPGLLERLETDSRRQLVLER